MQKYKRWNHLPPNCQRGVIYFLLIYCWIYRFLSHPWWLKKKGKFISSSLVERIQAGRGSSVLGVELLSRCGVSTENELITCWDRREQHFSSYILKCFRNQLITTEARDSQKGNHPALWKILYLTFAKDLLVWSWDPPNANKNPKISNNI